MAGGSSVIVAAIDLGTTYSGYAYSLKSDPEKVISDQKWIAGGQSLLSLKTPSCILFTPDGEFHKFGYEAENDYTELAENNGEHVHWFFFKHFKMKLYDDQTLEWRTTLLDIDGKPMSALTVFSESIRYLLESFMENIQRSLPDIVQADVTFVLTVPAIWNDKAKRFMREAAYQAGIGTEQLIICLEPEAASIWCQNIGVSVTGQDRTISDAPPGTKYMVVDAGGGTVDITVHEKNADKTLKEVHKASGGPWGGTEVDNAFINLLTNIVGFDVLQNFMESALEDYQDVFRAFEMKKRSLTAASTGKVMMTIPMKLREIFDTMGTKGCDDIYREFGGLVEWRRDKLKIDASLLRKCFDHPVGQIVSQVRNILFQRNLEDVKTIMLVGGFAESQLLQNAFRSNFSDKTLIIPTESSLTVLKGAVLFGHNPQVVSTRIARFTYGLCLAAAFNPAIHPDYLRFQYNGEDLCENTFWKAVEVGQPLPLNHMVSRTGRPVEDFRDNVSMELYKSSSRNPVVVLEEDCEYIGGVKMQLDPTKTSMENQYEQILVFGDTELKYFARHFATGRKVQLSLDF